MTDKPSGSAAVSKGASVSIEASGSKEASSSKGATVSATSAHSAPSEEADSADSTPAPLTDVPAPVAYQPNRWCVEGQGKIYRDAKILNDKRVMTRTLLVKR